MSAAGYDERYAAYKEQVEEALQVYCWTFTQSDSQVGKAAAYSLLSGGKRVRGCLVLAFNELLGGEAEKALPFAAAMEMVHAYSLIHDDLPCMDDDDMRRGMPSCHKAFGEATALLAGDALLTMAFSALACAQLPPAFVQQATASLSAAAGPKGMILGQELDLYYEDHPAGEQELMRIHQGKTGALIRAAVELGCASAQTPAPPAALAYAEKVGLVFQIIDDVLDVTADTAQLGKPAGSDVQNHKTTFVTLYGVEKACDKAQALTMEAVTELEACFGDKAAFLREFACRLAARKN